MSHRRGKGQQVLSRSKQCLLIHCLFYDLISSWFYGRLHYLLICLMEQWSNLFSFDVIINIWIQILYLFHLLLYISVLLQWFFHGFISSWFYGRLYCLLVFLTVQCCNLFSLDMVMNMRVQFHLSLKYAFGHDHLKSVQTGKFVACSLVLKVYQHSGTVKRACLNSIVVPPDRLMFCMII